MSLNATEMLGAINNASPSQLLLYIGIAFIIIGVLFIFVAFIHLTKITINNFLTMEGKDSNSENDASKQKSNDVTPTLLFHLGIGILLFGFSLMLVSIVIQAIPSTDVLELRQQDLNDERIKWTAIANFSDKRDIRYEFETTRSLTGEVFKKIEPSSKNYTYWEKSEMRDERYCIKCWAMKYPFNKIHSLCPNVEECINISNTKKVNPSVKFIIQLTPNLSTPQSPGKIINWTVHTNPEEDSIEYKFYLKNKNGSDFFDDQTAWTQKKYWIWNTSGFDEGVNIIKVEVRFAGKDNVWNSTETYHIENKPPKIFELNANPPSGACGRNVKWTANAIDPDHDAIQYKFWITTDGSNNRHDIAQDWSPEKSWNMSYLEKNRYIVKVGVRDGKHATEFGMDDSLSKPYNVCV